MDNHGFSCLLTALAARVGVRENSISQGYVQQGYTAAAPVSYINEVRVSEYPSPLRNLLSQLDELRAEDSLDMSKVGHLLVQLAADEDYLGPIITAMPAESSGGPG